MQSTVGVSTSLASLDDLGERIWWRLIAHSDPWGRLDARPLKLRALCWPLLDIPHEEAGRRLLVLQQLGRIIVWEHRDQAIIQIVDFEKHQPREAFRKRPPASAFYDPPANLVAPEGLIERLYGPIPETFRKPSGNPDANPPFAGDSGTTPETFRKPSGGDQTRPDQTETETRQEPSSSSSTQHHEPDDDAKIERLRAAGWKFAALKTARHDPDRAIAWLEHHQANPKAEKPGALARDDFETTDTWPPAPRTSIAPGAVGTRSNSPPRPDRPSEPDPERVAPPPEFLALANAHSRPAAPRDNPATTRPPTNLLPQSQ